MKRLTLALFFASICVMAQAQGAKAVIDYILYTESGGGSSINKVIEELHKASESAPTPSDRRSILAFLGSVQEHAGYYEAASRSYARAAGIAAPSAHGMPGRTAARLVIDAVRCALSAGDYVTAESYLSSTVKNSTDPVVQSYIKLYTAWCLLSRAESASELAGAMALLDAYAADSALESVRPAVLLTLWYIEPTSARFADLVSAYPDSPEAAVAQGKAALIPSPFWFFLPSREQRPGISPPSTTAPSTAPAPPAATVPPSPPRQNAPQTESTAAAVQETLQLGLFRNRGNAENLAARLRDAGFTPVIETRHNTGLEYFVVTMRGANDTIKRLQAAGFEAFPLR